MGSNTIISTGAPVLKATALITRERGAGQYDLLLLHHPQAGIQIPAGTVELDESPEAGACREAAEESGLADLTLLGELGVAEDAPPPGVGVMALTAPVSVYPHPESASWGALRRGFEVELRQAEGDFIQVHYWVGDRRIEPPVITFALLGWVPAAAVTVARRRHFYHFACTTPTPPHWEVLDEQNRYTLAWHPLDHLPALIAPQQPWLRWLPFPYQVA